MNSNSTLHPYLKQWNVQKSKINLLLCICVLFSSSVVCISAHANVYFKTTLKCPRSIARVPFDSVRRFRATLLLRTTCMRLCCTGFASCVQHNKPKTKKHFSTNVSQETHNRLSLQTLLWKKIIVCLIPILPPLPIIWVLTPT